MPEGMSPWSEGEVEAGVFAAKPTDSPKGGILSGEGLEESLRQTLLKIPADERIKVWIRLLKRIT
jgi:hypothetical protein